MPTPTYDLIASNVLAGTATSVSFNSIPGTYRDLIVVCEVKGGSGTTSPRIRLNNDTASNYSYVYMQGNGTTAISSSGTNPFLETSSASTTDTSKVLQITQIFDYAQTDKHKPVLSRANRADANGAIAYAQRWASTAAVTSLQVFTSTNNFAAGSTFYLYGIAA